MSTSKRAVVIFSDVEMGAPGAVDDFPHADFLAELLAEYTRGRWTELPIDLVFNGDTFDLLKVPVGGAWPHHVDKPTALAKLQTVLEAHQPFVEAVDAFLSAGQGKNRVHFVVGNHDAELLFPAVQQALREACGGHEQLRFPGYELELGPLHIEHGHQLDPLFAMDPERPFVSASPEPLLNLSWAAIGLLSIAMPLHPEFYFYDRLQPRRLLLELVPELKELFTALAWRYWTKDFWRGFLLQKDPLLRFGWTMAKEVVKRVAFRQADVSITPEALAARLDGRRHQLFVTGHLHDLGHSQVGAKRIVQAGAMRDEYHIVAGGTRFQPALKCFVEVMLDGERVIGLSTRELLGPPRPREHLLETVFDLAPAVRGHLEALGDQTKPRAEQRRLERLERPT